ncbi:MAG: FAD-dependent oxidoreductase [Gammaproteobacteria bacterium]
MATVIASPNHDAARLARANRIANWMGWIGEGLRISEISLSPILDLIIRLWLAQLYWVSGIVKLANWDTALRLATEEYPVSWLDPVVAAYLGASIELICPIFLALGLATRLAALPMLILALVIQFAYLPLNQHLYWAALLGWYVVIGAGALSLDRILDRGFSASALPFVAPISRFFSALSAHLGPYYRLAIRLWLAVVFVLAGFNLADGPHTVFLYQFQALLPASASAAAHTLLAVICPIMLALGLATRLAALVALLILIGAAAMPDTTVLQGIDYLYWSLLLGMILLRGPGPLAIDHFIARELRHRYPQLDGKPAAALDALPHVAIVGAGFGGISAARALRLAACRVTIVDRHNYHLFQPLLYQVATASLSPADVATPIRELFRDQFNAQVLLGEVTGIDRDTREVLLGARRLAFDYLILATGARHAYFGRDEWESLAPGLKQIDDATHVRRRLLLAFERAESETEMGEQSRLLTFVIVGGGPTGVELAGAIAELARHGMEREFRNIDPAKARVILVQAGPRILPTFPEPLSEKSRQSLLRLGVEVLTNSRVERIDADGVVVSGQRIDSRTVFWAAGVMASPAAEWVQGERDNSGRLKVGPDLSVAGMPNVFAIGDTALSQAWNGHPVPGLAPAAKQGGAYVAQVIQARIEGRPPPAPFRYRHLGSLATIGRQAAVADFGKVRLSGALAWWLWGLVHVLFLAGMRSRVSVAVQWFWAYLTFRRGTRLITGVDELR